MSEKFDGIRALWNGESLVSRQGNVIKAPHWFTEGFPKGIVLDGELWYAFPIFSPIVGWIEVLGVN